jgi:alpha-L-arabinofuranosidase
MKRLIAVLIPLAMLTGCEDSAVPVAVKFPNVPAELLEACPDLKEVDPKTTKLSEVISVVTDNYSEYHECRLKVDDWIVWYKTQKSIFDKIK